MTLFLSVALQLKLLTQIWICITLKKFDFLKLAVALDKIKSLIKAET